MRAVSSAGLLASPATFALLAPLLTLLLLTACERGQPADAATGEIARGKRLLGQYQCGACHTVPGVPLARGVAGPPLAAFGRRSYIAGEIPNRSELLAQWIVDPQSLSPKTTMPNMGVKPDDARAMAAYLHSLQ